MSDESQREATHSLFLRINAANEALSSDTIRQQYDQLLADGIVDYSDHEYKLLLRRQDEQQYGRYRAYAMRAARGDIEWGELAVMVLSLLCAVGPLVKWQWSEWKKRERAKEKAKESVRRGKRDVESKMKEQQRLEDELAKRRAAVSRQEDSDDEDDGDDAADSEERRREKETRRARVKKARAAVKAVLLPDTAEADTTEETKATVDGAADKLSSEDVELLVRSLTVEALEQLCNQVEVVRANEKRKAADKAAEVIKLFNEQVSAHSHSQRFLFHGQKIDCSSILVLCPRTVRSACCRSTAGATAAGSAGHGVRLLVFRCCRHQTYHSIRQIARVGQHRVVVSCEGYGEVAGWSQSAMGEDHSVHQLQHGDAHRQRLTARSSRTGTATHSEGCARSSEVGGAARRQRQTRARRRTESSIDSSAAQLGGRWREQRCGSGEESQGRVERGGAECIRVCVAHCATRCGRSMGAYSGTRVH